MSLGFFGWCRLEYEDDELAVYSYNGENFSPNDDERAAQEGPTGLFSIWKRCLEEPEVYVKRKKVRGRKCLVEKRVPHLPDIGRHISEEGVVIERLCGLDALSEKQGRGVRPIFAYVFLSKVFLGYQANGALPEECLFLQ